MCSLDQGGHLCEVPPDLPPLPDIEGISFYDISNASEKYVVRQLELLEKLSIEQVLTRHLLPWIESTPESLVPAKDGLIDWIFENSRLPTQSWKKDVMCHAIVPLPLRSGERRYRRITDMIDPICDLAKIYFEEEDVFPCLDFYGRHKEALLICGITVRPESHKLLERCRHFAECGANITEIEGKVECLTRLPIQTESFASESYLSISELRDMKWLPAISLEGKKTLLAPNECRGADLGHLVDLVWGVVKFSVNRDWERILGQ